MSIQWDPGLSVGVEELDVQHRQLLRRKHRLAHAIATSRVDDVRAELRFLTAYLAHHFDCEERWMERHGYPAAAEHARSHRRCLEEVGAARRDQERSRVVAHAALAVERLEGWIVGHLENEDLRLGRFRAAREDLRCLAAGLPARRSDRR